MERLVESMKKIAAGLGILLLAFVYYYITLPAINIHESGFWFFLGTVVVLLLVESMKKIAAGLGILLLAFVYYYITLPAINIHESGFWFFLGTVVVLLLVIYAVRKRLRSPQ